MLHAYIGYIDGWYYRNCRVVFLVALLGFQQSELTTYNIPVQYKVPLWCCVNVCRGGCRVVGVGERCAHGSSVFSHPSSWLADQTKHAGNTLFIEGLYRSYSQLTFFNFYKNDSKRQQHMAGQVEQQWTVRGFLPGPSPSPTLSPPLWWPWRECDIYYHLVSPGICGLPVIHLRTALHNIRPPWIVILIVIIVVDAIDMSIKGCQQNIQKINRRWKMRPFETNGNEAIDSPTPCNSQAKTSHCKVSPTPYTAHVIASVDGNPERMVL